MPCCDDCRPTKLGNGVDWMSIVAKQCLRAQGSVRLPLSEHPSVPAEEHGTSNELSGSRMQVSAFLHASSIPKDPLSQSTTREQLQLLSWEPLLGGRAWWSCCGGQSRLLPFWGSLWPSCEWKGGFLQKKTLLLMCLRPPTVITKVTVELWAIWDSFWATPIWSEFKKKSVSVVSLLHPFTFLIFFFFFKS